MIDQILKFFKKEYYTLNLIELSKTNLINNYHYLSSLNENIKVAPVLKSNAYGHGVVQVAQILDPQNAPFFCVDSLYEAYELYKAKIKTPILVMGYTDPINFKVKKLPFSFAVYDLQTLEILNKYQSGTKIHLKIDTGMHRLGIPLSNLPKFLSQLKKFSNFKVEGVMSHLASAKGKDDKPFQNQIKNFGKAVEIIKEAGFNPAWIHLPASEAILNSQIQQQIFQVSNMARVGLALYGISEQNLKLKPVLNLTTTIAQIKKLTKGISVGYDGTYQTSRETILGVLPIGYFDGVDRRLSNLGVVQVNSINCPIIGQVSMNITTIDLSKIKNPKLGQKAVIFSNNCKDKNSIKNSATLCQTIPYDVLVHLSSTTKRIIV
ncbi:alanine racemase [Candidatus Daviesbacteria bacterium]|nr:alanine racemase [Candidatus Daviesbacteria bacterium]